MALKSFDRRHEDRAHDPFQVLVLLAGFDGDVVGGEGGRLVSIASHDLFVGLDQLVLDQLAKLATELERYLDIYLVS